MKPNLRPIGLTAALAAILSIVAGCDSLNPAPASAGNAALPPTKAIQAAMTPQQALEELRAGNQRFLSGHPLARNPVADARATAAGQYPYAVVLSCIDSRQPVELVLDQGIGDIFSVRVAGNVVDDDVLGSLEFSCKVAGAKLIAVIGHSNCGAVKGAADGVELGNLTGLLARIKPAMDEVPADGQPRTSKNHAFINQVSAANVRLEMQQIRDRSPVLRQMIDEGKIKLVGGMYDLETGEVRFYEP